MEISGAVFATQLLDYETLFTRLRAGHTLITGNSRLTRVLGSQYTQWRIKQGDSQWQSPQIMTWGQWLDKLWEIASLQGADGTGFAVPGQRQLTSLWESTLKADPLAGRLLRPESLASQLRDTRQTVKDWQVDMKNPAWLGNDNENHAAFYHWNNAFEKRCQKDSWLAPEDRLPLLCKALTNGQLPAPGTLDLLGFDEFNPSQKSLLSTLQEKGTRVSPLAIEARNDKTALWKSKDSKDELQQMARWARYWFEKEPDSSIAVVVHDLQSRRPEVERLLAETLTPGNDDLGLQDRPWNVSMGTQLVRVPMIATAFDLLRLLDDRIDIQDIGRVLRSPWLRGGDAERNSRALLEKCLREKYPRQLTLSEVRFRASEIKKHDRYHNELPEDQHEPQPWHSPQLSAVLNTLAQFGREHSKSKPASAWAEAFDQLLVGLGWPLAGDSKDAPTPAGRAEEHDINWQTLQSWREALRELASLDATRLKLVRRTAISQLQQICREKVFQPRTPATPIQVLGLYEVSGLRFDHLWVVGLHNDTWPTSAKPNPFIPGKLQQAAQLPNSSPQRELEVARTITRRLLETSPDCVFSYPGSLDGEDVLPSPLLAGHPLIEDADLPRWQGDHWRAIVAAASKPRVEPLLMPGKLIHGTARGGSSILKHQALCPFRAFASNRLGADGLETPADGISAMLHGSLVHSVLEHFWKETKTQAALLALDEVALAARVRQHVNNVTEEEVGLKQRPAFRVVEADRVYRHVMDYLELETQRDDFEVVGFEEEILPEIEGQTIRLVIDRVDRLPSGEKIIIDYKTGKVEPKKWFGDRPEDSQLPLYAISAETTPAAVVFGIIRDDGCLYKGVVKLGGLFPGLPPKAGKANQYLIDAGVEMSATIDNWRQVIHRLMSEFLAGEAKIDPKNGTTTCTNSYCELQSLCRIGELEQRHNNALKINLTEASV